VVIAPSIYGTVYNNLTGSNFSKKKDETETPNKMLNSYSIANSTCTCGQHLITTLFGWIFGYISVLLSFGSLATAFMMVIIRNDVFDYLNS